MKFAPTNRLVLFAALLCPAALVAPLEGVLLVVCVVLYSALLVAALVDFVRSRRLIDGVKLELSPVTRLSLNNAGKIEVFVRRESDEPQEIKVGLGSAEELESPHETIAISLTDGAKLWTVDWQVTPRQRGVYPLSAAYTEVRSRLGLWVFGRRHAVEAEVRVYPNLRRDRRQLANLFMNRGLIGTHVQRMIGQGRDYEQLREYLPGDSMFDIHWKATAKRGEPVTKTYQVERTREIYLIVDHSRLSGRMVAAGKTGESDETALERFVTATSILNLVAAKQGDLFGLVTFDSKVSGFLRASSGRAHQQCVQDALFKLKTSRTTPDFDELFTFLRLRLRRRALLIFLTDLADPGVAEGFSERVRMITGQHVVLANMIVGAGVGPLFRPPLEVRSTDDLYGALGGHLRWRDLNELGRELRQSGVVLSLLEQENLAVEVVNQYLRIKQRQLV